MATGVDAVVLLSPQAFTYATGLRIVSHPLMRWRHAAAVVGRNGIEGVMAIDMEEIFVSNVLPDVRLTVWREFIDEPMEALAGLLAQICGSDPVTLGIELDFLPVQRMRVLNELLPHVTWLGIDAQLERARARKTPSELDVVRSLSQAADGALESALRQTRVGDTEAQLGERIISALYATGVSEHKFLIAASGTQTQYANAGPTSKVIEAGDLLRVEVFAGSGGYQAGVARTGVMGTPSRDILEHWAIIRGARQAGLDLIKPGVDARAVYAAYTQALGPLSKHAIAFFGHGMGLDMHELPYISASSTDAIEEGAIIGIEPFAMIPDRFGFQVKDVVAVTADGYEVISDRIDGGSLYIID
jgi:Xaa-Pro aminopeptidase